jgi:glycosyltransferase involved in cell wall biosynthesis
MTKIVQIQYSEESAGRAALRLQKAFLDSNIDSSILYLKYPNINDDRTKYLGGFANRVAGWDQSLQSIIRKDIIPSYGLYSYPFLGTDISKLPQIQNADFIILHWILHGFLNIKNIEQLINLGKPVIFFMHDMWTITGGCHYSFDCNKYQTKCHDCPMFAKRPKKDWVLSEFEKKLKIFSSHNNIYFVSPSQWLLECIKESALAKGKPAFYIPNVLDRTIFKPFEKKIAKQILNIDPDETVISFGAMSVNSSYKGWDYLKKALELLKTDMKEKNLSVLIFGSSYNKEIAESVPFKTKFMGSLKDEYSTALVYNASDIFIAPSLADNLPYTIFEALSCGTPVVAFNTGGIPDMVQHKINGYLANYKDPADIVAGVHFVLDNKIKGHLSSNFETSATVKKHQELFDYISLKANNI